jgi:hypothetical protein
MHVNGSLQVNGSSQGHFDLCVRFLVLVPVMGSQALALLVSWPTDSTPSRVAGGATRDRRQAAKPSIVPESVLILVSHCLTTEAKEIEQNVGEKESRAKEAAQPPGALSTRACVHAYMQNGKQQGNVAACWHCSLSRRGGHSMPVGPQLRTPWGGYRAEASTMCLIRSSHVSVVP